MGDWEYNSKPEHPLYRSSKQFPQWKDPLYRSLKQFPQWKPVQVPSSLSSTGGSSSLLIPGLALTLHTVDMLLQLLNVLKSFVTLEAAADSEHVLS